MNIEIAALDAWYVPARGTAKIAALEEWLMTIALDDLRRSGMKA